MGFPAKCVEAGGPCDALIDRRARQRRALGCVGPLRHGASGAYGKMAIDAVKPWTALRPPTGPSSPTQNNPFHRRGSEQVTDKDRVVVGRAEQPPTARPLHVDTSAARAARPVNKACKSSSALAASRTCFQNRAMVSPVSAKKVTSMADNPCP
jgi:hypothetical protein